MSSSKILSYMFFICWRFVHRTRAGFKLIAEVIQNIPVSSSGSAAVTERKYIAYLLLWSAFQRLAGARARLYHYRFLLPKQHVSSFFKLYRLCVLPRGALSCSLLVCHSAFLTFLLACLSFSACLSFLLLSFWFHFCSFWFLFCCLGCSLHLLAFIGVAWLFLACLGFSWFFLPSWLFLSFLFSCLCFFAGFLVCSVSWPFDIDTRLCKTLCPHPGEVVYLTYLICFLVFLV